jgi:protoheme IX farnesyltransferase
MSASTGARTLPTWLTAAERTRGALLLRDYAALTRPRVLALVLLTAPPALVLPRDHWPAPALCIGVMLGTALIGAGCGALNAWLEREVDAHMLRTCDRPLPAGRLEPHRALLFGLAISLGGLLCLHAVGGWLPTLIGGATLFHYVVVYTVWLKPRSPQNIVIGGAAGAAAPLIADAAVDGRLGVFGVVLFAIVFLWTPPHFWAIALYRKREYAAAGIPMMPSVVGDGATRWRMLLYALVLIPTSLFPWLLGALSGAYAAMALILGTCFVVSIVRAIRARCNREDRRVFVVSLVYLAGLFAAMLVELPLR